MYWSLGWRYGKRLHRYQQPSGSCQCHSDRNHAQTAGWSKSGNTVATMARSTETSSSHEEGCERRWSLTSNQFIGENGHVTGVEVEEVEWVPNPEGGRPIMRPTGKKEILKADLVLLAMGFLKPEHPAYAENVFLAGDAATGASLVVKCIAGGRKAAADIDAYLTGK